MRRLIPAAVALCTSSSCVYAVGFKTQFNCAGDYYSYCSQFSVGTAELRKCMRDNGPRLSKACINALIEDGEVSRAEVERQKEKILAARAKPKGGEHRKIEVAPVKRSAPELAQDAGPAKTAPSVKKTSRNDAKVKSLAAVAAPKAAKLAAKPIRAAEPAKAVQAPVSAAPTVQTVALDQSTFEALKARGPRFIEEEDAVALEAPAADSTNAQAPSQAADRQPTAAAAVAAAEPAVESVETASTLAPAPAATASAAVEVEADAETRSDSERGSIDYPEGRMSLGGGVSSSEPPTWWDEVLRFFRGE